MLPEASWTCPQGSPGSSTGRAVDPREDRKALAEHELVLAANLPADGVRDEGRPESQQQAGETTRDRDELQRGVVCRRRYVGSIQDRDRGVGRLRRERNSPSRCWIGKDHCRRGRLCFGLRAALGAGDDRTYINLNLLTAPRDRRVGERVCE